VAWTARSDRWLIPLTVLCIGRLNALLMGDDWLGISIGCQLNLALRSDRPKRRTVALRASVSSDRSVQRGSRFVGLGEDLNREGTLFASSVGRFLRRRVHSAMRGPGACFEIAESAGDGPAAPSDISARMGRDIRIRYSTVGVLSSARSDDPSSGKLLR
jgi:hypothetical protein